MKIEPLIEFVKRTGVSPSTIKRFYRKNPDLKKEVKFKKRNYYPIEHARYFNSEIMFDENKQLRQVNNSMRNVIECLMDRGSLQMTLWYMDWSYFFTVAYKLERNKNSCRRMMHGLYETLLERFGDRTTIRLFYTTEPFVNRNGYHNHFVIYISNKALEEAILEDISLYFEYDRTDNKIYDPYRAALFYMVKNGIHGDDWDILGNNLPAEGELYSKMKLNVGSGI